VRLAAGQLSQVKRGWRCRAGRDWFAGERLPRSVAFERGSERSKITCFSNTALWRKMPFVLEFQEDRQRAIPGFAVDPLRLVAAALSRYFSTPEQLSTDADLGFGPAFLALPLHRGLP